MRKEAQRKVGSGSWSSQGFELETVAVRDGFGEGTAGRSTPNSGNSTRFYINFTWFYLIFIELYVIYPLGFFTSL